MNCAACFQESMLELNWTNRVGQFRSLSEILLIFYSQLQITSEITHFYFELQNVEPTLARSKSGKILLRSQNYLDSLQM